MAMVYLPIIPKEDPNVRIMHDSGYVVDPKSGSWRKIGKANKAAKRAAKALRRVRSTWGAVRSNRILDAVTEEARNG